MNKLDFLRQLDRELQVLDKEERRELLSFYDERFYSGTIYEGKTEAEVIAELEHPRVIARNILEEYGASPKFVKKQEERYSSVSLVKVLFLLAFDLLIVSWLIPTLFAVTISVLGSSFSYIGTWGLVIGERTVIDQYAFAFVTGGYILLFLFGLVILDALLFAIKKVIILHLNVFKTKNRDKFIKKSTRFSVESWFKRHRFARLIKNVALIGGILSLAISGYWLFSNYSSVEAHYGGGEIVVESFTEDFSTEITNDEKWNISTDIGALDLELVPVIGTEFNVHHSYYEEDGFNYEFDYDTNTLTITTNNIFTNFTWSFEDLFTIFGNNTKIRIEVPEDLLIGDVDIQASTGEVEVKNFDVDSMDILITTGEADIDNIIVGTNLVVQITTGSADIDNVSYINSGLSSLQGKLTVSSTTGTVSINTAEFDEYALQTTTGSVKVFNLNLANPGSTISAKATTGNVKLQDVYVNEVYLEVTTGNISYHNIADETYEPEKIESHTTTGSTDVSVDEQ